MCDLFSHLTKFNLCLFLISQKKLNTSAAQPCCPLPRTAEPEDGTLETTSLAPMSGTQCFLNLSFFNLSHFACLPLLINN